MLGRPRIEQLHGSRLSLTLQPPNLAAEGKLTTAGHRVSIVAACGVSQLSASKGGRLSRQVLRRPRHVGVQSRSTCVGHRVVAVETTKGPDADGFSPVGEGAIARCGGQPARRHPHLVAR